MANLAIDFRQIMDEDVLKRMWQEAEDFGLKKEIRTHMYKLRESRLRDLYNMDTTGANYGVSKTASHGNLVDDHSFESFKSKEIRDSESPTRDKYVRPATGEWNVISSAEKSADGKEQRSHMLATTGGVKVLPQGQKSFSGLNEEKAHSRVEGDDKNYVKSLGESSRTETSEHVVTGDDSGRTESKSSSFQSSSSSSRVSKTITNDFDSPDFRPTTDTPDFTRSESMATNRSVNESKTSSVNESKNSTIKSSVNETRANEKLTQHTGGEHLRTSADPAKVQQAFQLAQKPGDVVARTVERTKPDTVCITETKLLTDGTKVTTKRFERVSTTTDIKNLRQQFGAIDKSEVRTTKRQEDQRTTNNQRSDIKSTTESTQQNKTFVKEADERTRQAFKLAEKPGEVVNRNVERVKPDTVCITETKLLTDGTKVTTKRFERVSTTTDIKSLRQQFGAIDKTEVRTTKRQEDSNTTVKDQRSNTERTTNNQPRSDIKTTENTQQNKTFLAEADDRTRQAFKLAEQPGEIVNRNVERVKPDTVCITETKLLTDGTKVTTKRYEKVVEHTEKDTQKKTERHVDNTTQKKSSPEKAQPTPHTTTEVTKLFVEVDKAHDQFARSLRCVTPPPPSASAPTAHATQPPRKSDISPTVVTKAPTTKPYGSRSNSGSIKRTDERKETSVTETFIKHEKDDGKPRKAKPVLKRTETYEDRCKLLIGIPDKTTENQSTDVDRKSSFNKTTSDISFDKKSIQNAKKTTYTDHYQAPDTPQKSQPKRTYVSEESDTDRSFTKETVASKMRKNKPDRRATDEIPTNNRSTAPSNTRFTSYDHETVKITRDKAGNQVVTTEDEVTDEEFVDRQQNLKKVNTEDTEKLSTSSYIKETVSSTMKKIGSKDETNDRKTSLTKDTVTSNVKHFGEPRTTTTHDTVKITRGTDETTEEYTDRKTSVTRDTVSSTLKKVGAEPHEPDYGRDRPRSRERSPRYTETIVITKRKDETDEEFIERKNLQKDRPSSRDREPKRFTSYEQDTVKITRDDHSLMKDTVSSSKKKVGSEPREPDHSFDRPSRDRSPRETILITKRKDETDEEFVQRRTSLMKDTVSSTMKKIGSEPRDRETDHSYDRPTRDRSPHEIIFITRRKDETEEEFERRTSLMKDTVSSTKKKVGSEPRDHDREPTRFTSYEQDTVKITRDDHNLMKDTVSSSKKKVGSEPREPHHSLDRPSRDRSPRYSETILITKRKDETDEEFVERRSSVMKDKISSTKKKIGSEPRDHDRPSSRDREPTRFTSYEQDTIKITRDDHNLMKDTVSSSKKKVGSEPRDHDREPRDRPSRDRSPHYSETILITKRKDETDEEFVQRRTSLMKDTVSSTMKKIGSEPRDHDRPRSRDREPTRFTSYEQDTVKITRDDHNLMKDTVSSSKKKVGSEPREPHHSLDRPSRDRSPHYSETILITKRKDETDEEFVERRSSVMKDTISSTKKKIGSEPRDHDRPSSRDREPTRFTSYEQDTIKITRDDHNLMKDTVSSSKKKVGTEPREPDYDRPKSHEREPTSNRFTSVEYETILVKRDEKDSLMKDTVSSTLKKKGSEPRDDRSPSHEPRFTAYEHETVRVVKDDHQTKVTDDERSTNLTKDTVSSYLKKINAEPLKLPEDKPRPDSRDSVPRVDQPSTTQPDHPTPKKIPSTVTKDIYSDAFINTERQYSTHKKPATAVKPDFHDDQPRTVVESEDEYITTKRTSYASDTISSSLKKSTARDQSPSDESRERSESFPRDEIKVDQDIGVRQSPRPSRKDRVTDFLATEREHEVKQKLETDSEGYNSDRTSTLLKETVSSKAKKVSNEENDVRERRGSTVEITIERRDSNEEIEPKVVTDTITIKKDLSEERRNSLEKKQHKKKCLATKTINLSTKESVHETDMIIDIQKSKSSREPSPNKLIPVPVSPDDEVCKQLPQRFPDKIIEPDDIKPKKKPVVTNIPIFEEHENDFVGVKITELDENTIVHSVTSYQTQTESDEDVATLSVSQKVNHFITEAEKLRSPTTASRTIPKTPEFERRRNRFIEKIVEESDGEEERKPAVRQTSPVTLKSTEAVKKARAVFEGSTPSKPRDLPTRNVVTPTREVRTPTRTSAPREVYEDQVTKKEIKLVEAYEEKIVPKKAYKCYEESPKSPKPRTIDDDIIPVRDSNELISASRPFSQTPEREVVEKNVQAITTTSVKKTPTSTAKRPAQKSTPKSPGRIDSRTPRRPSDDDRRTTPSNDKYRRPENSPDREPPHRRPSTDRTPSYLKDAVTSKKDIFEKKITSTHTDVYERRKSMSPQVEDIAPPYNTKEHSSTVEYERSSSRELPSYMSPTVSSLVHSNRKFSIETHVKQVQNTIEEDEHVETVATTKTTPIKTVTRTNSKEHVEIEEIYDLDILERMLEKVVGYEQRRRIRAQIRVVKKLLQEGRIVTKVRRVNHNPEAVDFDLVQTVYTVRPSATKTTTSTTKVQAYKQTDAESPQVIKKETTNVTSVSAPMYERTYTANDRHTKRGSAEVESSYSTTVTDTRKATPKVLPTAKTPSAKTPTKTPSRYTSSLRTNKQETSSKTKQVTKPRENDFGVTPDFENGMPLFGLRALRKKDSPSIVQSKVTGTVVTEKMYSENGSTPMGERKVTHYSTDPIELEELLEKDGKIKTPSEIREKLFERQNSRKGLQSVTMTEKFGEDIDEERRLLEGRETSVDRELRASPSRTKIDALKQKFSSIETSSSVTETTSSNFPKAGLILRSQRSSRSSTPGGYRSGSVDLEESDVEVRALSRKTSREKISSSRTHISHDPFEDEPRVSERTKSTTQTQSFLDSESRSSDVQDLLHRLKNVYEVKKPGETAEEHEARELLNKFLGASVLMTGAESLLSDSQRGKSVTSTSKTSQSSRTAATKRTYSPVHQASGNKAIATESINDEETLRQLIESSKSYDERRELRARLRQVMAEKKEMAEDHWRTVRGAVKDFSNYRDIFLKNMAAKEMEYAEEYEEETEEEEEEEEDDDEEEEESSSPGEKENELLPLLQGLLDRKSTPSNEKPCEAGTSEMKIEDSGTESGEDFRLLAGLQKSGTASILGEVNAALSRLQDSLKDGNEIDLDLNKRNSLLNLVTKLRSELLGPPGTEKTPKPAEEAKKDTGRFAKRRNRQNRHTVGVSREELADARRLVEAMIIRDALKTLPKIEADKIVAPVYALQKQKSVASIGSEPAVLLRPSQFVQKNVEERKKLKTFRQSLSYEQPIKSNELTVRRVSIDGSDIERNKKGESSSDDEEKYVKKEVPKEEEKKVPQEKVNKFALKKNRLRRANTVDMMTKTNDIDTDDENTDHEPDETFKRFPITPKVGPVKVAPELIPKKESDEKFLALLKKQEHKIMPSWVSPIESAQKAHNWNNKFGQLKNAFEGKPPLPKQPTSAAMKFWKESETTKTAAPMKWQPPKPEVKPEPLKSGAIKIPPTLNHEVLPHPEPPKRGPVKIPKMLESEPEIIPKRGPIKMIKPLDHDYEMQQVKVPKVESNEIKRGPVRMPKMLETEPSHMGPRREIKPITIPKAVEPAPVVNQFSHAPTSAFKPLKKIEPQSIFKQQDVHPVSTGFHPPASTGHVKQLAANGYKEAEFNSATKQPSPTKNLVSSLIRKNSLPKSTEKPTVAPVPWSGKKQKLDTSQFETPYQPKLNPKYLPADYQIIERKVPPKEPEKPLPPPPTQSILKRNSLIMDFDLPKFNDQFGSVPSTPGDDVPAPMYTITDYTPSVVSTFAPQITLSRSDSLTNPEAAPLVLTNTAPVYTPEKYKSPALSTISSPLITAEEMSDDSEYDSSESGQEYQAVSKVMAAPISGTAVTVSRNSQKVHNDMALSLHASLKKITKSPEKSPAKSTLTSTSDRSSIGSSPYDTTTTSDYLHIPPPKLEVNSPTTPPTYDFPAVPAAPLAPRVTPQFQYNYTATKSAQQSSQIPSTFTPSSPPPPLYPPVPKQSNWQPRTFKPKNSVGGGELQRAKSSHYLAVPRQAYDSHNNNNPSPPAPKPELSERSRQIAAYFAQSKSRTITTAKPAVRTRSGGLSRSQTIGSFSSVKLLDESNVEDAFEQLLK